MSKTIVFKKEFEDKLKKLRIKTKFINNLKTVKDPLGSITSLEDSPSLKERIEKLNDRYYWIDFIYGSFTWDKTPEGHAYWENIARK
jgi:hypothetical protein